MALRTPLYDSHVAAGARIVEFAGWDMPLHYGSQIDEHNAVRGDAGMFDVSHMAVTDIQGRDALPFLRRLLANDPDKLTEVGKAIYGALLNEAGGIVDDLIVYRRAEGYRAVTNAGTREKVLAHVGSIASAFQVDIVERRDLSIVAIQGPHAIAKFEGVAELTGIQALAPFTSIERQDWLVCRTGYTGEEGVEVILPGGAAPSLWRELAAAGVKPAGLAARDTLRLEAGFCLYGVDMDERHDPFESNIAWTVALDPPQRDFVGRNALEARRTPPEPKKLTGIVLDAKGVMRHEQRVATNAGYGVVTSGLFSPTLGYSIALARVPRRAKGYCEVEIRGRMVPARVVRPPFVRHGKKVFS